MSKMKKKKLKGTLVTIVLLVTIGGVLFVSRYEIAKVVKNVPILNQVFKQISAEEELYEVLSEQELKDKARSLEKRLEEAILTIGSLENDKVLLNEKIDALKQYEAQYNEFMLQKSNWDEEVARTNPELFIEQIETMYPDTAIRIYEELKGEVYLKKEQKALASTIGEMDALQAAGALTELIKTDPELVKSILRSMNKESQADILNEVGATVAAQMIKLISP